MAKSHALLLVFLLAQMNSQAQAGHESRESDRTPEKMASSYVPLDSWIYPAFERLVALGYVQTAYPGLRPWTRLECARLLEEAGEQIIDGTASRETEELYGELELEFSVEEKIFEGGANRQIRVDAIYTRLTQIAGSPLRDGYHFAQTMVNDYGRPYASGLNSVTGVRAHAAAGPVAFYFLGEYQQAPATPRQPASVLEAVAEADGTPSLGHALPLLAADANSVNRFRLQDAYASLKVHSLQFSFGQQSLWLGATESGPLLFSNNAEPMLMLRVDSVSPYKIPFLSYVLGPARSEFFIGQLSGQRWVFSPPHLYGPEINPQPFLHGTKLSFRPTRNLEFGMGFTAQFGGPGLPFTWHNFLRTFLVHRANLADNPAKRLSQFDLSYRIPGMRNLLTFYLDSMVIDEYSPLGSNRPSLSLGIYLAHLPKISRMDFRAEGITTDLPTMHFVPGAVYRDGRYISGDTNDGMLMGSWMGRMGQGGQAWATYWCSPRNTSQFGYRHQEVDQRFIGVGGGRLQDFSLRTDLLLRPDLSLGVYIQYEPWRFATLAAGGQSAVTTSLQFTFRPNWKRN